MRVTGHGGTEVGGRVCPIGGNLTLMDGEKDDKIEVTASPW